MARPRLVKPQMVTIRPLDSKQGDEFGDAPVVASDNRKVSFTMRVQVTWSRGSIFRAGSPGKDRSLVAVATMLKRNIPPSAPSGWEPTVNDLVELASGRKLFIDDIQPAFPRRISLSHPLGGFDGWRVFLVDMHPTMAAATEYEE